MPHVDHVDGGEEGSEDSLERWLSRNVEANDGENAKTLRPQGHISLAL